MLPCEVRVIAAAHPLFGRVLEAISFKRLSGVVHLVVGLPDGTPGTIAAAATSVFGDGSVDETGATTLSVEAIRRLQTLVGRSSQRRGGRKRE